MDLDMAGQPEQDELDRQCAGSGPVVPIAIEQPASGRYRLHRETPRSRAVKVLYAEDEMSAVRRAAHQAGLRPSSYVAAAALAQATNEAGPAGSGEERELLAELLQTRLAVRQYGAELSQIAAAANARCEQAPTWVDGAVAGADRAVARIDEAARQLSRRLV